MQPLRIPKIFIIPGTQAAPFETNPELQMHIFPLQVFLLASLQSVSEIHSRKSSKITYFNILQQEGFIIDFYKMHIPTHIEGVTVVSQTSGHSLSAVHPEMTSKLCCIGLKCPLENMSMEKIHFSLKVSVGD